MKPERRAGQEVLGGKWEFTGNNDWLQPYPGESFEITSPLPVHGKIKDAILDNFLDPKRWHPAAVVQQNSERERTLLYFVFEDPLTTYTTKDRPNFSSALKEGVTPNSTHTYWAWLYEEDIQQAMKGTNMVCKSVSMRFNAVSVEERRFFRKRDTYKHQSGVVFFQLGFIPIDQQIDELEKDGTTFLGEYKRLQKKADELGEAKVDHPQPLFVKPSIPVEV